MKGTSEYKTRKYWDRLLMPYVSCLDLHLKLKEQNFTFIVERENMLCVEIFFHITKKNSKQMNNKRHYFGRWWSLLATPTFPLRYSVINTLIKRIELSWNWNYRVDNGRVLAAIAGCCLWFRGLHIQIVALEQWQHLENHIYCLVKQR